MQVPSICSDQTQRCATFRIMLCMNCATDSRPWLQYSNCVYLLYIVLAMPCSVMHCVAEPTVCKALPWRCLWRCLKQFIDSNLGPRAYQLKVLLAKNMLAKLHSRSFHLASDLPSIALFAASLHLRHSRLHSTA